MLLQQGADPNVKDNAGWTPLVSFCSITNRFVMFLFDAAA